MVSLCKVINVEQQSPNPVSAARGEGAGAHVELISHPFDLMN